MAEALLAERLLVGIKNALSAGDLDAAGALLRQLAVVDPVSAQTIYDVIQARAVSVPGQSDTRDAHG